MADYEKKRQTKSEEKPLSLEGRGKGEGERPELKDSDRLRLENQNLKISNLNLQLALLNERARSLQMEIASLHQERERLVTEVTNNCRPIYKPDGVNDGWKLNPDTMEFEKMGDRIHTPSPLNRGEGQDTPAPSIPWGG